MGMFEKSMGISEPVGFYVGLDLGQARDYSAVVVNRKHTDLLSGLPFHCLVFAHRFHLGTPYPAIAREIGDLIDQLPQMPERPELFADSTGVGRPLIDLLQGEGLRPWACTLTAGQHWSVNGEWISLPKAEMVSNMTVVLQRRLVAIAAKMPFLDQLVSELQGYSLSRTDAGNNTFGARTEAIHDDLVVAAGLALFGASKRWGAGRLVLI